MEIGTIVDYCIAYNDRHKNDFDDFNGGDVQTSREATQADWDALLGG